MSGGPDVLAAHAADCEQCRRAPLPLPQLAALLPATAPQLDPAALSRRTLAGLQPTLRRVAAYSAARRTLAAVLVALVPLPAVLLYDASVLRLVYGAARLLLPASVAAYAVCSYGGVLLLLFALTYAAIPLFVWPGAAPLGTGQRR